MLHSYDLKGGKDSFSDLISNISPEDTFIVSESKKQSTATSFFKWQTDHLDKVIYDLATTYDVLEGADAETPKQVIGVNGTTDKTGQTQIFRKVFSISDSALATSTHGREGELKYQLLKAGKELKNVMEVVFSSKQAATKSSDTTAPKTDGLFIQIAKEDVDNPDLPAPKVPGENAVHKKAAITFEAIDGIANALYRSGSKANVILTNYANSAAINAAIDEAKTAKVDQLEMFNETSIDVGVKRQTQVKTLTDSLGRVWEIKYSRFAPVDLVYFVNADDLTQRVLREPKATRLGKQGSSEEWQLVIEAGLQLSNPYAAGVIEVVAKP